MWHRKPVVAGTFYPGNAGQLKSMIDNYIKNAVISDVKGSVMGIISPHAGYVYSGPVAGYSFKLLDPDTEVAVVLAPSHRARFNGASVIPEGAYETPFGDVDIDSAIGSRMVEKNYCGFVKEVHEYEHSLEVQVPFLQTVLKSFSIVPVIIGTTDLDICRDIAGSLSGILQNEQRKFVIVISTDLSHYYPYDEAVSIDKQFIDGLQTFNVEELKLALANRKAEACGEGPVLTGLMTCRNLGAQRIEILKYANSGDTAGDKSQVVGYVSAAIVA